MIAADIAVLDAVAVALEAHLREHGRFFVTPDGFDQESPVVEVESAISAARERMVYYDNPSPRT